MIPTNLSSKIWLIGVFATGLALASSLEPIARQALDFSFF